MLSAGRLTEFDFENLGINNRDHHSVTGNGHMSLDREEAEEVLIITHELATT